MGSYTFDTTALDMLMPMHLSTDISGHISHAGPALSRLRPGENLVGQRFLEVFEMRRPGSITSISQIGALSGQKLHMRFRKDPETPFKGLVVPMAENGGMLLNLSFGIGVTEAVRDYGLTSADFAPTDLTVEMLYLVEVKSAVMDELRKLNSRLQGAKVAAEEQAFTDTLTGLKNRRAMDHVLARYIERGERFGLMHLDLDFFKDVNDTLGHAAGDHVLQHVANILVAETRVDDTVIRAGGDEFVIIFPRLTAPSRLNDIAKRIIGKLERPILFNENSCRISASVGTTVSEFYASADAERMLADADIALYASKHGGRARATIFSDALSAGTPLS